MDFDEQELRRTPREVEQVEAALNAEAAVVPELVAAMRATRENARQGRFAARELNWPDVGVGAAGEQLSREGSPHE
ncbi:hypothetical protein [Xylanimonas sp. McL0601]|uniref:hypothetical protein n=1 Tax=Xylanimonas sp. McL0601 TaxID=3414739 RepID=UPI003CFA9427